MSQARSLLLPTGTAALIAALLIAPGVSRQAAAFDLANAVTTPGSGTLTKCRSWLVYTSCTTHHRVDLPEHVAVGDKVELSYGSNLKSYTFHVVRIRHEDDTCTFLSEAS